MEQPAEPSGVPQVRESLQDGVEGSQESSPVVESSVRVAHSPPGISSSVEPLAIPPPESSQPVIPIPMRVEDDTTTPDIEERTGPGQVDSGPERPVSGMSSSLMHLYLVIEALFLAN